jgi:hypothetical protein
MKKFLVIIGKLNEEDNFQKFHKFFVYSDVNSEEKTIDLLNYFKARYAGFEIRLEKMSEIEIYKKEETFKLNKNIPLYKQF